MEKNNFFPLKNLHDKRIDSYTLHLGEVKQLLLTGWKGFKLYLKNSHSILSTSPVIKGIYSVGGKDGVKPWMDLEYYEELKFFQKEELKDSFSLSSKSLDRKLFKYLGDRIPLGGHLMVSYEGEQKIHTETIRSLNIGIPPVATPLGLLIFLGGFQYIKDWYLAEGGHEGPRKLWGEKAPDEFWAQTFYQRTAQQIVQFLERKPNPAYIELEEQAKKRSKEVLEIIKKNYKGNLSLESY